jgi:hypothetical protein
MSLNAVGQHAVMIFSIKFASIVNSNIWMCKLKVVHHWCSIYITFWYVSWIFECILYRYQFLGAVYDMTFSSSIQVLFIIPEWSNFCIIHSCIYCVLIGVAGSGVSGALFSVCSSWRFPKIFFRLVTNLSSLDEAHRLFHRCCPKHLLH